MSNSNESPTHRAIYEWMLAVAPVGVYVASEHLFVSTSGTQSIWTSAEWGIATAFLSAMTVFLLLGDLQDIDKAKFRPNKGLSKVLALAMLLLLFASFAVAVKILIERAAKSDPTASVNENLLFWQWTMFFVSSASYIWVKRLVEKYSE